MKTDQKFIGEGLTYDDVLLIPAYSEVMPRETNTSSFFHEENPHQCPHYFCRDGHGYRIGDGYCYGAGRRNRCSAQEHEHRSSGC
jgi:hypothetical protein